MPQLPLQNDTADKPPAADLVTETDKAVEEMVSSSLRKEYPTFE